jgi:hypothetical protein
VQFLGTMIMTQPGEDLGRQQRHRIGKIPALMLLVPTQMLQRTGPGQQVETRREPRMCGVKPGPSGDLRTSQPDTIGRLGRHQDRLRCLHIGRIVGHPVHSGQDRCQQHQIRLQSPVRHGTLLDASESRAL